jgi:malonate-semialdehyde dehydrogenase (acetylating)/methylmalonate-semialdehyde dehydrogenase
MDRSQNFIGGEWRLSSASEALNVINPASAKVLAEVPLSPAADVNAAVEVAQRAFLDWRRTPVVERIQPLFRLKTLLEQHRDELALSITDECGKTLAESKGEILRAVGEIGI